MTNLGLPPFEYSRIETQIIEAFPKLRPAAEEYWMGEGWPGDDPGPHVFFSEVVSTYFEILLAMPPGSGRNRLLGQGFEIIDQMLMGDTSVSEMVWIELMEGRARWWLARVQPFLGRKVQDALDEYRPGWRTEAMDGSSERPDEIIDLCGAGDIVLEQLRSEGIGPREVPGVRVPRAGRSLSSLESARRDDNGVAFLSCFGTTDPYVLAPASEVACEHATLIELANDLAQLNLVSPGESEPSEVGYYRIFIGERVWRMLGPDYAAALRKGVHRTPSLVEHEAWEGLTWLSPFFPPAIHDRIRLVLSGQLTRF